MSSTSLARDTLPLPRWFGRYQLFDRIGAGGMAEIFLARAQTELGGARLVVVKQILPELSGNERFAEMLITEAKLAARLNHANVVQVFDLGRHESVLFIAMEYVEGFDLNELLRRCARQGVPLPVDFALLIVMEALKGLGYAHRCTDGRGGALGVVHRDVSPSNILISFEGEVKLCDFGIARANDMTDLLSEEVIKGKASYMSPEHARGEHVGPRADIFSAGIVLWELLAGRKLYKVVEGGPELLTLAKAAQIPSLPERGMPHEYELHAIVARALAPVEEERYGASQAMLRELEGYVARARLMASPIRFGEWLRENFGAQLIEARRARERAAKAFEVGPAATVEAYGTPPPSVIKSNGGNGQYQSVQSLGAVRSVDVNSAQALLDEPKAQALLDEPKAQALLDEPKAQALPSELLGAMPGDQAIDSPRQDIFLWLVIGATVGIIAIVLILFLR